MKGVLSGRSGSRSTRVLLGLFLAMHAARCLGLGVQAGRGDVGAAARALTVGARLDAGEGGFDSGQVRSFAFAQGKFQFALGGHLGARVFRLPKVFSRHLGAADDAAALRGQLGQQLGLLGQQLLAKWGGLGLVHAGSPRGDRIPAWCACARRGGLTKVKGWRAVSLPG